MKTPTPITNQKSKFCLIPGLGILILALASLMPQATRAADISWQGGTADYTNAADWVGGVVPGSADNAINDNGTNNVVGINSGDGDWHVNDIRAGNGAGSGAWLQTAQTATLNGWFRMGIAAGDTGFYTITGGTVNYQGGDFNVGELGTGVLNINGGTITGTGNFADNLGGSANTDVVTQVAGAVNVTGGGQLFVGNNGAAIYNLSGGSVDVHNYIAVGRSSGNGTLNMTGGTFNQDGGGNLLVGTGYQNNGSPCVGVINQSAGTINDHGQFLCPENAPGVGTYNLSGTGQLIVNDWLVFGRGGGAGVLNISGGSILQTNSGGNFEVGETTPGTVNQTGGAIVTAGNDLWIGQGGGATGTYNMNGGSLSINSWLVVGRQGGNGTLNLTNGTVTKIGNSGNHFDIGAGGTGIVNQYGGFVTNVIGDLWLGESTPGTWNLFGGTAVVQNVVMCVNSSASAQLSLNGGLFQATSITSPNSASAVSILSLNGGTLQANANNTTFISGVFQTSIGSGGVTIDSQGYNITVPEALADNGGGSLTKIGSGSLTLTGANSYAGATTINGGTVATTTASSGGGGFTLANGTTLDVQVVGGLNSQLNLSSLSLSASATTLGIDMNNFGNPSSAPVNVTGALTVNGTLTINVADENPQIGQFHLITYASKTGTTYVLGSLPVGVIAHLVDNTGANSIDLDITSVNLPRWDGNAGGNWDIGLTTNWVNSATGLPTFYQQGNAVTFDDNATGTTNVNLVANVTPGSLTINNNVLIYNLGGTGSINGSVGIVKEGASSFTINTTNGYTGPTIISAGTLAANNVANGGSPSAIGAASANPTNLVIANATFSYVGTGGSMNRGYTLENTNCIMDIEGNLAISGVASSFSDADFMKSGPAQLTYTTVGVNALSGATSLGFRTIAGTTKFDGSAGGQTNNVLGHFGVGGLGGTNATVILTNSTLNVTTGGIDLGRSGGAVGTLVVGGSAVLNSTSGNFALGDGNGTVSTGVVSQVGGVVNLSGPQMFVGQNNSGVGSYTISGGTLNINNWLAIGRQGGSGVFNISGGALVKTGGGNLDIGTSAGIGGFSGTGVLNQSGGAITNTASQTWLGEGASGQPANGTWNMTGGTAQLGELHIGMGGTGTNVLNISGASTITSGFLGLSLNDTNTIADLNMTGGTITVNSDMTVGDQGTAFVNFTPGSGAQLTVNGTLYLSRSSPQANGTVNLNAGNTLITDYLNNGWGFHNNFPSPTNNPNAFNFNGGTLRANVSSGFFIQPYVNAVVQSGGAIIDDGGNSVAVLTGLVNGGGGGGLTKQGAGVVFMNGTNTYTGPTTVAAGALAGIGSFTSPVTVASGAALAAGWNAIGTLTINSNLTFSAGSTSFMKLGSSSFDQIAGLTSVTYSGALVVTNTTGSFLTPGNVYQLFRSATPGTGNFASVTLLPAGTATFNPSTGQLTITSSGAPLSFNPATTSNGNLILTGSGGTPGSGYSLLSATNVATPFASWITNTTGTFSATGTFSNGIPVSHTQPAQFFRIRTP